MRDIVDETSCTHNYYVAAELVNDPEALLEQPTEELLAAEVALPASAVAAPKLA